MRVGWLFGVFLAAVVVGASAWASFAWASSDRGPQELSWRLGHSERAPLETTVMLAPSNDTVVNMMLLRLQATGQSLRLVQSYEYWTGKPRDMDGPFYDGDSLSFEEGFYKPESETEPEPEPEQESEQPYHDSANARCTSHRTGRGAFIAAVHAAGLAGEEEQALIAARNALSRFCRYPEQSPRPSGFEPLAKSAEALIFARYLEAAWAFYDYDDLRALDLFAKIGSLTKDPKVPWVHEAATYMEGRTGVEMVKLTATGPYGLLWSREADPRLVAQASRALGHYLTAFPKGRYHAIAEDAQDYLHWLGMSREDFVSAFSERWGPRLSNPEIAERGDGPVFRFYYVDHFLRANLERDDLLLIKDPFLLATFDLNWMRHEQGDGPQERSLLERTITAQDLAAQAPIFAGQPALYQMLQASHAYYVTQDPQAVLALIPDDSAQPSQGAVPFTLRMLRGMAISALRDPRAAVYWTALLPQASQPGQRPLVELAIALEGQQALPTGGAPAKKAFYDLFATDGPLKARAIRARLLAFVADAPLLRQQAKDLSVSALERKRALFTLLYKSLTRGQTKNFAADLALIPANPIVG
jgi:hypothetical protein